MSKSIYEEAIEIIDINTSYADKISILGVNDRTKIEQALEQAQKQRKLLELYREYFWLSNVTGIEWPTLAYNRALEIKNKIKELENDI